MPTGLNGTCESCELRSRCIRYGWMSPAQVWFPDVVMLCPVEGCRRFALSLDALRHHFTPAERDIDDVGGMREPETKGNG
jgi:hypothetical protein